MSTLIVCLTVVALGLMLVLQLRWHWYVFQYLYFLRIPLLAGFVLVFCWVPAVKISLGGDAFVFITPGPFQNLFVLHLLPLGLVTFVAIVAAWTIAHAFRWVYVYTPWRLGLSLRGYTHELRDGRTVRVPTRRNTIAEDQSLAKHALYGLLALPLVGWAAVLSPDRWAFKLAWVGAGIFVAFASLWVVRRVASKTTVPGSSPDTVPASRSTPSGAASTERHWLAFPAWLDGILTGWLGAKSEPHELGDDESDANSRALASGNLRRALIVSACVYVAIAIILWPGFQGRILMTLQGSVPALVYLLLLLILGCLLISWLSLWLDKYRLPAEVVLLVLVALAYRLPFSDTDHYYELRPPPPRLAAQAKALEPREYLNAWRQGRSSSDLIVVAASGGGVTAAAWTAAVLGGLQEQFPNRFAPAIAIVSTTSGGSVGAMYYIGRFMAGADGRSPQEPHGASDHVWFSASRSSLGAMAWGIAYPELARLVFPPLAFGWNRGWALERRWAQPLTDQDASFKHTIREWARDARAGWRPVQVFNATQVETGRRFLISPMAFHGVAHDSGWTVSDSEPWRSVNFIELYGEWDIDVVTAARLSATFPFVTPVASPWEPSGSLNRATAYHVADGGYFDNFGVMTAIDFVREILPVLRREGARVLFVEIRASSTTSATAPRLGQGFRMETLGPAETLMSVRSTSQLERNNLELQLLRDAAPDVVMPSAVFELRTKSPLSWHLSYDESEHIRRYWLAQCQPNRGAIEQVAAFLAAQAAARPASTAICKD